MAEKQTKLVTIMSYSRDEVIKLIEADAKAQGLTLIHSDRINFILGYRCFEGVRIYREDN